MLVDDNRTFLAAVRKFLMLQPGTQVVAEAHNGTDALALAAQVHPDLILLDIVMPGMNGFEVAKSMQAWPKSPQILFLSMHDNESYRLAARKIGALGLVGKSDFVVELMPMIDSLVAGECAGQTGIASVSNGLNDPL